MGAKCWASTCAGSELCSRVQTATEVSTESARGVWLGRVVPIVAVDKDKCTRIESDSQMCRHPTGIQITLEQRVAIARYKTDVR